MGENINNNAENFDQIVGENNKAEVGKEDFVDSQNIENKPKLTKEERIQKERDSLLAKLASNNLKDIRSKVAFILNHHPETRNSDIKLAFAYWKAFQSEHMPADGKVDQTKMFKLERMPSLVRARAKIQNEFGLFGADEEIREKRRSLEFKEKEEQLTDKPGIPSVTFYIDESGKNQKYVVVGGLCSLDAFRTFKLTTHLMKWAHDKKINHEFHFTELTKHKLNSYKEFFTEVLSFSDSIGFKAVALPQSGIKQRTIDEIVTELHYQLVHKAMEHEVGTKRVSLPRQITVYKDKEDGTDGITMAKLQQDLKAGFKKHFGDDLSLETLEAIDSKSNSFIQLADLYIGSIARILNREKDAPRNHKDEFAEFVITTLDLDLKDEESYQDIAFVCVLK